ncbi:ribonuclease E/G [Erythrobacteraceae bacterium CFH 75059]|uniref:Rne/Rng family ribonuclease n=1 Tax=Qipengyuania thermophila TaxID=2509361 RepID=UPI001020949B|nr:ribonuclease E/G [Qipengyuania thermophila]TCD05313.1 ribonuclease E/G [Erythrobacteraceae bacterium CFH 75059]
MTKRMLIDARHAEETRVAVLDGQRIEEFDFESAEHKQIKGNIYLAKVTRVEPSLQAAFVDFGGNRHGFLAFSEIHPDYYQIPHADRIALLEEEARAAEEEERLRAEDEERGNLPGEEYDAADDTGEQLVEEFAEDGVEEVDTSDKDDVATIEEGVIAGDRAATGDEEAEENGEEGENRRGRGRNRKAQPKAIDEARERRLALRRRYRIQDVIQRRQVLLVQVVKEERGNKGAALTTYLSLAGRYTVLMPNSAHGGGISRKISSAGDRKRLKQIVADLELPRSMGLIVRTAGLSRTKPEIKRDFDYLARLWDEVREKTLKSTAPTLIHSDSDLIKRAIRDLYHRDIEEVVVEGAEGFRSARQFMKLLMPSHARRVKPYTDPVPLFQRHGAEDQLRAMYEPVVQLKSGGYLVINPTEALVSIDINSGRSTREHGIEQTAVATNLEAAEEIARQLRLRDMAGLVVIDFIDMERSGNVRKVERALKEALKNDRARIQIGRISSFGLLEMSRQRLRTGVLEATTRECPHCDGTGLVRTASSAGLTGLRLLEEEAARGRGSQIVLSASTEAAIYLLNSKRADLQEIEQRYGVTVEVLPEGENEGAKMSVASKGPKPSRPPQPLAAPTVDLDDIDLDADDEDDTSASQDEASGAGASSSEDERRPRKRRRRGGRNRNRARHDEADANGADNGMTALTGEASSDRSADEEGDAAETAAAAQPGDGMNGEGEARPARRRRRGGRGRRGRDGEASGLSADGRDEDGDGSAGSESDLADAAPALAEALPALDESLAVVAGPEDVPHAAEAAAAEPATDTGSAGEGAAAPEPRKPRRRVRRAGTKLREDRGDDAALPASPMTAGDEADSSAAALLSPEADDAPSAAEQTMEDPANSSDRPAGAGDIAGAVANDVEPVASPPARRGWWQRTFGD